MGKFNLKNYNYRIEKAQIFDKSYNLEKRFPGYDDTFNKLKELFSYESLHKYGIIHSTSDVFIVLPNNEIILQRRSINLDSFPGCYSPSAGGHIEYDSSPLETAIIEVEEELGLKVDSIKNVIELNEGKPIEIFYHKKELNYESPKTLIHKFHPDDEFTILDRKNENLLNIEFVKDYTRESKTLFYNQELAFFYVAFLHSKEFKNIKICKNEVASIKRTDVKQLKKFVSGMNKTDTFNAINKSKIIEELEKIIAKQNG